MLGLLVYLSLFLWGMATDKLRQLWLILFGGGVVMTVLASVIQHYFLQGI
jgi:CHASE1-domain containing sensor protein